MKFWSHPRDGLLAAHVSALLSKCTYFLCCCRMPRPGVKGSGQLSGACFLSCSHTAIGQSWAFGELLECEQPYKLNHHTACWMLSLQKCWQLRNVFCGSSEERQLAHLAAVRQGALDTQLSADSSGGGLSSADSERFIAAICRLTLCCTLQHLPGLNPTCICREWKKFLRFSFYSGPSITVNQI